MPGSADETAACRPLLFSIAYGMTGSVGDAEDIVQDAFLGLTRARQAGTEIADPKAYLAAGGDMDALLGMLAPDVVLHADGGGRRRRSGSRWPGGSRLAHARQPARRAGGGSGRRGL